MTNNARLAPWLELADELVSFDRFMHEHTLAKL